MATSPSVQVYTDGNLVEYDVLPIIQNGRTMVPIRHTISALGVSIVWDNKSKKVTTKSGSNVIILSVGKNTASVNGKTVKLDTSPIIVKGRTLIPLRFISENYGFKVEWDNQAKIISITSPKIEQVSNEVSTVEVPVLMYHILIPGKNDSVSIDPVRFKEQMLALRSAGYTSITENDLLSHLEQGTVLPEKPVLITFDDGYISNYTEAFPVLKELDMKASIYVIASRIFENDGFTAGEYEKISWQQAREMAGTISIQSHTWDSHSKRPDYQGRSRGLIASPIDIDTKLETQKEFEDRVYTDLAASKKAIEKNVGTKVTALSYPYGDYTADTIRLAKKAGYKMAFTVRSGVNFSNSAPFELTRTTANGSYSGNQLIKLIESHK
ncbi:stalk domain-containing protein [Planococcus antarcticus]|uniref:stalk domain-containing protein n=1 Tax=Planococcus antarcticus TaxID=161360 RepID=UPI001471C2DB|nr:stalk domain-containing protein [Planococcus antarcticus]